MAREIRQDRRLRARARVLAPLALGLFLTAALFLNAGEAGRRIALACLVGVGVCFLVAARPLLYYRCPACGLRSRGVEAGPPAPDGAVVWYRVCPRCDVAWDTGWGHGGPSEGD
jgi:hypothetical protein